MVAKTRFLCSAALSYVSTAPATAAHLMSRCQELSATTSSSLSTSTPIMACMACGCIELPGWTSHKEIVAKPKSGSQRTKPSTKKSSTDAVCSPTPVGLAKSNVTAKMTENQCLLCRRTAKVFVRRKDRVKKPMKVEGHRKQDQVAETALPKEKRSKIRKKTALRAILANSKAASTAAPVLGLMDLMTVV